MAKKYGKKTYVGKVMKGAEDGVDENGKKKFKPDYIVVDQDFKLMKGDFLRLESKAQRIKDLQAAVEAGRLDEEKASDLIEKANKGSDKVRFTIIHQEVSDE